MNHPDTTAGGSAEITRKTYPKIRSFCEDLTGLVERGEDPTTIMAVKDRLEELIKERPDLPEAVSRPSDDSYARHLLYGDPHGRFEVVVMAWGPGQSTPVHDHSGMWCVEGVVRGVIDVTRYDLREYVDDSTAKLEPREVIHAGLGQCGALIPPVEYHRIANPYSDLALTIHVYGGQMRQCRVFEQRGADTYTVATKDLHFANRDAALPAS